MSVITCYIAKDEMVTVGGLHLSKVLKNTTNIFSSIVYCHRKLRV
jgi:hypothetical protein